MKQDTQGMVNVDHEVIIMIIQETSFCHRNETIVSQCQKITNARACVMCHLLPVTCHLSCETYSNSHSHRPSPC